MGDLHDGLFRLSSEVQIAIAIKLEAGATRHVIKGLTVAVLCVLWLDLIVGALVDARRVSCVHLECHNGPALGAHIEHALHEAVFKCGRRERQVLCQREQLMG